MNIARRADLIGERNLHCRYSQGTSSVEWSTITSRNSVTNLTKIVQGSVDLPC